MKTSFDTNALAAKLTAAGKAGSSGFVQIGNRVTLGSGREIVKMNDGTELPGRHEEFMAAIGNPARTGKHWNPIASELYENGWWIDTDHTSVSRVFVKKEA